MILSANGFSAGSTQIASYTIPGTAQRVPLRRGDAATVLLYVAKRYNLEVEPIHVGWCWGYAFRNIRGRSVVSNHASGTAIDLNAPRHSLGTHASSSFSMAQIRAIRSIVASCGGVVRWGGDYTGRTDPMHFELIVGGRRLAALAARLRKGGGPAPAKPAPPGAPAWYRRELRAGMTGRDVREMQTRLRARGFKVTVDGVFGRRTRAVLVDYQKHHGLTADGVCGQRTARSLR